MPSNMAANTNHNNIVLNSKYHKTYPLNAFPLKFRVQELLCALSIFGISKITTHCLREHWSRDLLVQEAYCP